MNLEDLLRQMVKLNASDLYVKSRQPAHFRINKVLVRGPDYVFSAKETEKMALSLMNDRQKREFDDKRDVDLGFGIEGLGRFRATVFLQRGTFSLAIRWVKLEIPSFEELNLPADVLKSFCRHNRGLVLVTGATGSGKSTTLASMIEYINQNMSRHIVSIEDPIEFIFSDKKSVIEQREVRIDTVSYRQALRCILRQSPDIIMIDDIRDQEAMHTVLMTAESGHLVISTLHTINAVQAVEKIINFFPPYQHHELRKEISLLFKGVLCLRLLPRLDNSGLIPAYEIMISTPTLQSLIAENRISEIPSYIKDGKLFGMRTFNQTLTQLYKDNLISKETALENSDNPEELMLALKGIYSGRDSHGGD
jgi:twitching motility protein PilT